MTRKQRRLSLIGVAGVVLAVAVGLVLYALSDGIAFFATPSEIAAKRPSPDTRLRLGGLVETGSLAKGADGAVQFAVTDGKAAVSVHFTGILPDLFREGQGVVAEGRVDPTGFFAADTILAKHDETYMPKEVVEALKRSGEWRPEMAGQGPPPKAVQ